MTHPQTRAVRAWAPPPPTSRPVAVPLYQTSTFAFEDPDACAEGLRHPDRGYSYTRHSNPTTRALETAVADLEGGVAALATASGMGAINAVLLALLRSGDHLIVQRRVYGGTQSVLMRLAERFGVAVTRISGADAGELAAAVRPETRLLYLETIANPTTEVADLPALLAAGRAAGLVCVVDNTFATPMLCRPIEYGADVVVHSATKYLGGHDDVVAGLAVFASRDVHERVWHLAADLGAVVDPFASWLVLRGLKTLALRVERHCENAGRLAHLLEGHPRVAHVRWPGLPSHPSHAVARRILDGYGGVLSFEVDGDVRAFLVRLRCAELATSLGGPQTLVLHPATTSHRELDEAELRAAGISPGTLRVSAGLEHHEDLLADFAQALKA
ncbi:O-acetylhomoserine sulfhydrylase / O-succinylhomoserine sulfhydrylase [[Actinomadura] parvosata subsp. kistnae]|uniref:homocysteine desulfhydrase n=1 Tax=[Actinomadura] parvosata subsp. kistnae TaxID=1909395 RepID=A0A1V0A056_9ACTN|nr:aminotransferase class I/II-fold pyridoxal phosphate-dependent enzyme [Nonomuraea sp. ATCC 55076]AQZ63586.1 cystathionine gamma-synthase [Nonomuraea sp. ATCC 55076]SPL99356.1 O-acetylhomoserine sulfhydrylase / O-succinylhomoserine sulfhydrylase [Actinomadura parvosata subsp. kistnae]